MDTQETEFVSILESSERPAIPGRVSFTFVTGYIAHSRPLGYCDLSGCSGAFAYRNGSQSQACG